MEMLRYFLQADISYFRKQFVNLLCCSDHPAQPITSCGAVGPSLRVLVLCTPGVRVTQMGTVPSGTFWFLGAGNAPVVTNLGVKLDPHLTPPVPVRPLVPLRPPQEHRQTPFITHSIRCRKAGPRLRLLQAGLSCSSSGGIQSSNTSRMVLTGS